MQLTQVQRWSNYITVIFGLVGLFIGFNLRDSVLNAVTPYVNTQAGIQATYPRNWLLDDEGDYVFRVRDMTQQGFKTTIQVAVRPISSENTERNVLDALVTARSTTAAYTVIGVEPYVLSDETPALWATSTYVDTPLNPFLQGVPVSVESVDVIAIKRGQAIVITFISDALLFEQNLAIFEQFLESLEF
jgi:hypothetical protein